MTSRPGKFLPPGEFYDYDQANEHDRFSGHDCTLDEVRERLVTGFHDSNSRARLFAELDSLVRIAHRYFDWVTIHVAGEFVTSETEPRSIEITLDVLGGEMAP